MKVAVTISPRDYDVVLFDLDGVLTRTASVHAAAWKRLFAFSYRTPEITQSLLMYRYRRLGEARAAAERAGFKGAMFPWQSGSDGQEAYPDAARGDAP